MNKDKMIDCIETERLVLFPYTQDNLSLFNSDLPRFEAEFGVVYRGEELDYLLAGFLKKLEREIAADPDNYLFFTEFLIVLKANSHIIGSIDYKYVPVKGVTEVGYGLNPAYEGHGYMSEALTAFLEFGRKAGIRIVRADTRRDNVKSQNVLKRCGFYYLRETDNLWWETVLADVRLSPVTEANWLAAASLSVKEEQKTFVAPAIGILARGYVYRDCSAKVYVIEAEGKPVGLVLVREFTDEPLGYDLQQFMIDADCQGRGYGSAALAMILDELRREARYDHVEVCVKRADTSAIRLYEKFGFTDSGYVDEDVPDAVNMICRLF